MKRAGCGNADICGQGVPSSQQPARVGWVCRRAGAKAHTGRLTPGSPGTLDFEPGGTGGGTSRKGHRLPVATGRRHWHNHGLRGVDVQHLLEPGAVRAAPSAGTERRRLGRGPRARTSGAACQPSSPPVSADPRAAAAKRLHKDRSLSIAEICKALGNSRPTFYHCLARPNVNTQSDKHRLKADHPL